MVDSIIVSVIGSVIASIICGAANAIWHKLR